MIAARVTEWTVAISAARASAVSAEGRLPSTGCKYNLSLLVVRRSLREIL